MHPRSILLPRAALAAALAVLSLGLFVSRPVAAAATDLDLAALRGKVVYIDFWASWCAPCRQSFPWMNELQRKFGSDDFVIIGVNVDHTRAEADAFLADVAAEFRIVYDPDGVLAERYKVKGMPSSVLIDRNGNTVFAHEGFRLKDREALEKRVRAAVLAR
jgi:thiol-disulfide isomerase/thioredoxin